MDKIVEALIKRIERINGTPIESERRKSLYGSIQTDIDEIIKTETSAESEVLRCPKCGHTEMYIIEDAVVQFQKEEGDDDIIRTYIAEGEYDYLVFKCNHCGQRFNDDEELVLNGD